MQHPTYGHLTYRVDYFYDGTRTPSSFTLESWQAAYAHAKRTIRESAAGIRRIDIIKLRSDGFIFQGIFRWDPANGRTV